MKIWVDHLPTEQEECLFYGYQMSYFGFLMCVCKISNQDCKLKLGEKCPYLQALCGSQSW